MVLKAIKLIESKSKSWLLLVTFVCVLCIFIIITMLQLPNIRSENDYWISVVIGAAAGAVVFFVMLRSVIGLFTIRKRSIKNLSDAQKSLYLQEINGDEILFYALRLGYAAATPHFIVQTCSKYNHPAPIVLPIEDLLCITVTHFYDNMRYIDYINVRFWDASFTSIADTVSYFDDDANEIITHVKNTAPWVSVYDNTDDIAKFRSSIASKQGKKEFIEKVAAEKAKYINQ